MRRVILCALIGCILTADSFASENGDNHSINRYNITCRGGDGKIINLHLTPDQRQELEQLIDRHDRRVALQPLLMIATILLVKLFFHFFVNQESALGSSK